MHESHPCRDRTTHLPLTRRLGWPLEASGAIARLREPNAAGPACVWRKTRIGYLERWRRAKEVRVAPLIRACHAARAKRPWKRSIRGIRYGRHVFKRFRIVGWPSEVSWSRLLTMSADLRLESARRVKDKPTAQAKRWRRRASVEQLCLDRVARLGPPRAAAHRVWPCTCASTCPVRSDPPPIRLPPRPVPHNRPYPRHSAILAGNGQGRPRRGRDPRRQRDPLRLPARPDAPVDGRRSWPRARPATCSSWRCGCAASSASSASRTSPSPRRRPSSSPSATGRRSCGWSTT